MRCLYNCEKNITGEVDRDKMLTHLKEEAVAIPDKEERVEFVPGTIRGKQVIQPQNTSMVLFTLFYEYNISKINFQNITT